MSRTYRRKNYEDTLGSSWDRRGRKIGGYYTERDFIHGYREDEFSYWWVHHYEYRAPTKREKDKAYWHLHGDTYYCSNPRHWFRQLHTKIERQHHRNEICKFFKDPDYEVMAWSKIHLPYWD